MGFYGVASSVVRCVLKMLFRVEIEGVEKIPQDKNFIIAPNHLSNFDPPMLGVFLPTQMNYMAKEELFKIPLFGSLIKALGAFPIKRGGKELSAIKTALGILKENRRLVIFPEGKRSRTPGVLSEGKHGVVMIAHKAGVGILPVGIEATYRIGSKVKIRVGDYMDLSKYHGVKLSSEEMQRITDEELMPVIARLAGARVYGSQSC